MSMSSAVTKAFKHDSGRELTGSPPKYTEDVARDAGRKWREGGQPDKYAFLRVNMLDVAKFDTAAKTAHVRSISMSPGDAVD